MYIEKIAAPAQAIMKRKSSFRKNNAPIKLPSVKIINTTHKKPPMTVKSYLVWKAKIVKARTIAAVNPTAKRT
jgi:hypothetical protein